MLVANIWYPMSYNQWNNYNKILIGHKKFHNYWSDKKLLLVGKNNDIYDIPNNWEWVKVSLLNYCVYIITQTHEVKSNDRTFLQTATFGTYWKQQ